MQGSVSLGNVCKKENQTAGFGGVWLVGVFFALLGNILKIAESFKI